MKVDIFAILGTLGSGALIGTLKGLDIMTDDQVKETLTQVVRKIVEQPGFSKARQRRLVGLLRDAASEVFVKDLQ